MGIVITICTGWSYYFHRMNTGSQFQFNLPNLTTIYNPTTRLWDRIQFDLPIPGNE